MKNIRKTVLVTGTSSGIGLATALYFQKQGWNVAATLRSPEKDKTLGQLAHLKLYRLDVTDEASIAEAIRQAIADFGGIDAIVNNAGYGAVGIFEAATNQQIQRQFDTNVFGVMNVIRAILPYFRERRDGTIINVTSMGGRITFPIYSLYHGTKWAVEGFAESLSYELRPFNIRVKNVEPGAIKTEFYHRSMELIKKEGLTAYDQYEKVVHANVSESEKNAIGPEIVAKKIFFAANDRSFRLRYLVGSPAPLLLALRSLLPLKWYMGIVRSMVEKGFKNN